MKEAKGIGLPEVQEVYCGPEGELWELIMGEQIHIGGLSSSLDLAEKAGIPAGSSGIDLCCCSGAGMRFLLRFRSVAKMHGIDATAKVIEMGRSRCAKAGVNERVSFTLADACESGLPSEAFDFSWGEDAWCYVADKKKLVSEAVRLVKKGGSIAFTDWVEGNPKLSADEASRYLRFMKFPNVLSIEEYSGLLEANGCIVEHTENTGRFAPSIDLYLEMLGKQLSFDALRIIGFNAALMQSLQEEMLFMRSLAHSGKIAQGLFVARKK
ncbi:MAG: hypothetical protein A2X49_02765 [Lentisphaerae bacterium GWF2_52_8]|nr:MAG: hypothetical protein A2X49_02765 [Lentisphaerae bacterium GWF2_52_8]